jgi:hypothetical protein
LVITVRLTPRLSTIVTDAARRAEPPEFKTRPDTETAAAVGARFEKHAVTSFNVGVCVGSVEFRKAVYFRYRLPLNCASEPPLVV